MQWRTPWSKSPDRLTLLADIYAGAPETGVDVGLRTVPVTAIRGTTSPSQTQRGQDFIPLWHARGNDWQVRWLQLRNAADALAVLPPIEVVQVGDGYWVVDGHNRVALALSVGQLMIDADVTVLRWPGGPTPAPAPVPTSLDTVIEQAAAFRFALQASMLTVRSAAAVR